MGSHRLPVAFLIVPAALASPLELLQQIPLSDYVRVSDRFSETTVTALAFSPDEQWLAAAVNHGRASRLLVLSPERKPTSLRFSGQIGAVMMHEGQPGRIAWSPDMNAVAVGTTPPVLVDLERETKCHLEAPDTRKSLLGAFPSSREVVIGEYAGGKWRLVIYDRDCTPIHYRELPSRIVTLDAVAERGWILAGTADGQLTIYDAASGAVVKTWRRAVGREAALLLGGAAVCQAGLPSRERTGPECWRVEEEEGMMDTPKINGGAPFSSARTAPMVAFTDGKYSHDSFFNTDKHSVRRGIIWHFDRSKILATWSPEQLECGGVHDVWDACKMPAPFALSAEGRYLAESRSRPLRIYRIAGD